MMKRKFTARESALLLILVVMLLGLFYYLALYRPVNQEVERCAAEQMAVDEELDPVCGQLYCQENVYHVPQAVPDQGRAYLSCGGDAWQPEGGTGIWL